MVSGDEGSAEGLEFRVLGLRFTFSLNPKP